MEQACDMKVHQLLVRIHQRLNQKFPFIQQTRQLSFEENQLLQHLPNQSVKYKILVAAMAIDTYSEHIVQIFNEADSILQIVSICLSCVQKMKIQIEKSSKLNNLNNLNNSSKTNQINKNTQNNQSNKNNQANQINQAFSNLYNSIITLTQSVSILNPNSPYLQIYRSIISNKISDFPQHIYNCLRDQNKDLKDRLQLNDQKIIQLQIKLTRILQQHDVCQTQNVSGTLKSYELRQQLQKKQQQILKMNEQFTYQIQKYNIVYQTLKKQLQEYKSYQNNVDTVQLIERLQTEIVVLREEKQREQMINQQLRHRMQILSDKDLISSYSKNINLKRRADQFNNQRMGQQISPRNREHYVYSSTFQKDNQRDDPYQQIYQSDYYHIGNEDNSYTDTENDTERERLRSRNTFNLGYSMLNRAQSEEVLNSIKNTYRY